MEPTIAVPERIKEVARKAWKDWRVGLEGVAHAPDYLAKKVLEDVAAHPPRFSDEQKQRLYQSFHKCDGTGIESILKAIEEAFRMAYVSAEPELPQAVKQLIEKHFGVNPADWVKALAVDSYRAGMEARK